MLFFIAGARPNFMKVAPLIKCVRACAASGGHDGPALEYRLVHTGQHYDAQMSGTFFDELGIPAPDFNLEVGSGSHAVQTAAIMTRFEAVCLNERPDWVVVVGDVNSSLACALVAAKLGIKVAHVEAGLRSFDRTMPEEINRIVTDALADLLLTPSADANANLRREGVPEAKIRLVGNIMIDSLVEHLDQARARGTLSALGLQPRSFVYATLHRPANVDERETLTGIMDQLMSLARRMPVVFPVHPRTRRRLCEFGIPFENTAALKILDPVGYHDSLCLTEQARFVLTDSGGLQEESTFFRTPCLTLRPNTERPVTIQLGSNRLTSLPSLEADIDRVLSGEPRTGTVPPLWDGHAAPRVLDALLAA
jgi:UDP-N-acetylglucosamine 2-epimerase (non-hydrolysing)